MASVIREILIDAPAAIAWSAVKDVGNVHTRLVPGFVAGCTIENGERTVTFLNGVVIREIIVDIDDDKMRLSYASVGGQSRHHNASIQIFDVGGKSRLVWTTDVLPNEIASYILTNVNSALPIMKKTIESAEAR